MMPGPGLPDPKTEHGQSQLKFSMLTCSQQIDSKIFAYMKRIRPRHALVIDEQKGVVATFSPVRSRRHTARRPARCPSGNAAKPCHNGNVRHSRRPDSEVEASPFVTLPYGLGNGWSIGSGR